ncbi:MAG TPA: c-type cytochrome, partial [Chitinophagaceae bacterium]|nr:c-type cytochrome [Chitinophagaceae bacterium]
MQVLRLFCRFFIFMVFVTGCGNSSEPENLSLFKQVIRQNAPSTDWSEYNGDGARSHFSKLAQVSRENVNRLKLAWTYSSVGNDSVLKGTQVQCNPIIVNGILYGVSPTTQVFALDAATGKEIWKTSIEDNGGTTSRGVTYYGEAGYSRIFFGAGKWLYAIDAETGKLAKEFGSNGKIDLKEGITRPGADNYVVSNTPNTIYKDIIIVGARVAESETALLGDIRAYNVHTGKLVWTFRTIPAPEDPGYDSWYPAEPRSRLGGANCWAGMAIDRERGIVYVPTGSAASDFYGGNRKGNNLYANCLLALDAATGRRIWHFQLVHHDIFDRDPPAPPNLVTVMHNGVRTAAVAQITKQGFVFLFNRVSGEPLFEIIEKKVRTDGITGEYPSPTQPYPVKPKAFTRQEFTEKDFNPSVADRDSLVNLLRHARNGGAYTPIGKEMTIIFPATDGGGHWGGAATDEAGILYVPSKQLPGYTSLVSVNKDPGKVSRGDNKLYNSNCSSCHGDDRKGNHEGSYPSLAGIDKRLSRDAILQVVEKGKGMMPSFSHLSKQ